MPGIADRLRKRNQWPEMPVPGQGGDDYTHCSGSMSARSSRGRPPDRTAERALAAGREFRRRDSDESLRFSGISRATHEDAARELRRQALRIESQRYLDATLSLVTLAAQ